MNVVLCILNAAKCLCLRLSLRKVTKLFCRLKGIFHVGLELKEGMKLMQLHEEDRIVSNLEKRFNVTTALKSLRNFRIKQKSLILLDLAKVITESI